MKTLLLRLFALLACFISLLNAGEVNTVETKNVVILLGPPGSGKGTQAQQISKELGIPHISTGDLFRENLSKGTALGNKVKSYMDAGKLVPDDIVIDMLMDRVAMPDCSKGYLLDGFPRSVPQAEALDKHLGSDVHLTVLSLQVSDDLIIKRIEGRMTCPVCGTIYNTYFSPPKIEGVCDKDGAILVHRSDDNAEVIKERLKAYHEQTAPLVDYYDKKGVLIDIDGEQEPDQVYQQLIKHFK